MHPLSIAKNSTESGFTLVEIAIVLVIIGLLLGGILKGQEMITQAKIKNVVNDFNGITVAVTSYQNRYPLPARRRQGVLPTPGPSRIPHPATATGSSRVSTTPRRRRYPGDRRRIQSVWQHLRVRASSRRGPQGAGTGSQPPNAAGGIWASRTP